ncbi:nitrogen assimilation transcriptional regulator NAC [Agrobacterium larrymoorei]|uniref:HTH-type transcriptional regulator TtuA n=1 Tax=Agrobacterium larrymoorei TaxID=160699 RepID=A0A4D7DVN3_9HYPH|nr:nitrogen assimilation transcriptional regulator NAC [Agrobacterium larrymoorei]QCJ01142.1 nitrogen assimilation transcriptional regulator [Agrobacterium larrymoorei]QYA10155.1 nitrogen assimilation transcriptional regulator NAC [Agrobacterium larrymoorei]
MSVDFKKLKSFVKIIDTGSVSRAASILRVAQPALSQQIASLEQHFKHQLLIRSNVGITPTEAGLILYRNAQIMLKQIEQTQIDIDQSARSLSGRVSIGLATYSSSSALSLPLIKAMRARFPDITVHINDSFGHILSELIMTGKMDMALIYTSDPIKGVSLRPLFREEMYLVSPAGMTLPEAPGKALPLSSLDAMPLLLPSKSHFLRRLIDDAVGRARAKPEVISELESIPALSAAVLDGLGSTILPASVVLETTSFQGAQMHPLTKPVIDATVSLCTSDHLPLSEPALAARSVLLEIVAKMQSEHHPGIRAI